MLNNNYIFILLTFLSILLTPICASSKTTEFFTLKNLSQLKCLTVTTPWQNKNGGKATITQCRNNNLDQEWDIIRTAGSSWVKIKSRSSSKCLTVDTRTQNREGGLVTVSLCGNITSQKWRIYRAPGSRTPQIQNRAVNRCLNINGRNRPNGTQANLYTCNGTTSDQKWKLGSITNLIASCGEPERYAGNKLWLPLCFKKTFSYRGVSRQLVIYYTLSDDDTRNTLYDVSSIPSGVKDVQTSTMVRKLAAMYTKIWKVYLDLGFNDPLNSLKLDVFVYESGKPGWCCQVPANAPVVTELSAKSTAESFSYSNRNTFNSIWLQSLIIHELGHAAEGSNPNQGGWSEGIATVLEDLILPETDRSPMTNFMSITNSYFTRLHKQTIDIHDYIGGLWWKYYTEQFGRVTNEPERGIDAILNLWRLPNFNSIDTIDRSIRTASSGSRNFESAWIDFTVANIAKDQTRSLRFISNKFKYFDSGNSSSTVYKKIRNFIVDKTLNTSTNGGISGENIEIQPLSARYIKLKTRNSASSIQFNITQNTNTRLAYSLIQIKPDNTFSIIQSTGRNFVRMVPITGGSRAILVITGLKDQPTARINYLIGARF